MRAPAREVTVHAPGLLGPWPGALLGEIGRGLELPGLVGLLARARRPARARRRAEGAFESFERLAFGAFGYPPGEDDVPAAALMWERDAAGTGDARSAGDGRDEIADPVPMHSLRADPVHVRPDLDAARIFDIPYFGLSGEEAGALAGALDRHFAPEGLRFEAPHAERWYVRLEKRPDAAFHPPGAVVGRDVGGRLPGGNEGSLWRRRMNEAQMVLHGHRCNEAREARGELPVNSVWFWGAGELGPVPRVRFEDVFADDSLIRALAVRGGARVRGLDEEARSGAGSARACLVAPGASLYRAVVGRDVEEWRRELVRIEEGWFRPLHEEMHAGAVRKVVIDAGLRSGQVELVAASRRWLRPAASPSAGRFEEFLLAEEHDGG